MILAFIAFIAGFLCGGLAVFLLVRATPIKVYVPVRFPLNELAGLLSLAHANLGRLRQAINDGNPDRIRLHSHRADEMVTKARILLLNAPAEEEQP